MLIHSSQGLAKFIYSQRKHLKLSQSQASSRVGLKQGTLSRFETHPDNTQLATLFRILSALDLEMQVVPKQKSITTAVSWREEW